MDAAVNPPDATIPARIATEWDVLSARSARLLAAHQDASGAWPASPGFAPYGYCWFRDGAFIADGASAAGLVTEAGRFHDWCQAVLRRERPAIDAAEDAAGSGRVLPDDEYLPARYRLDGTRQRDDWWNFQVDGYGTWLWALRRHLERHPVADEDAGRSGRWDEGVELATRYLVAAGLSPCRDWWEENRDERHVATLAGVAAGLETAVHLGLGPELADRARRTADEARRLILVEGVRGGRLTKWLGSSDVDASLLSVFALYDVLPLDDPRVVATVAEVERSLTGPGVHRYGADTFYGGGQWPVLGALLATYHVRTGGRDRARALLDWVASTADDDLLLPEQVAPRLAPDSLAEWEERWGASAHPLLWSHGAFLSALEVWARA